MDKIVVLGTYFSYDLLLAEKYNLLNLVSAVNECLNMWGCRGLTLTGRILSIFVPDQVRTLSQVGTSSNMAYAMQELTQEFQYGSKSSYLVQKSWIVHVVFTSHVY